MIQSQADCKPSLAAGMNSEDTAGTRKGQDRPSVEAMVMVRGESRVRLAASSLSSHQAAQFVVPEQGPVSAEELVPLNGLAGQKRSQQQCMAGRIQGQVIQSHKVASSESSGWQEREPRSARRELSPEPSSPPE